MSNLKYLTPTELREQIASLSAARQRLEDEWTTKENEAAKLLAEAKLLRKKYHNLGQRECWARIYLASKSE